MRTPVELIKHFISRADYRVKVEVLDRLKAPRWCKLRIADQ